jgi:DNA modification methylase
MDGNMAARKSIKPNPLQEAPSLFRDNTPYVLKYGDALATLRTLPTHSIHCCVTSPPYWAQRAYDGGNGLGSEPRWQEYVAHLTEIFHEVRRVLRPDGSLWLNLGDTYVKKNLCGIPWRVAFALQDDGWLLRNDIVWDKVKGNPCNAKDKLRNVHEYLFHFTLHEKYFYDVDAIRTPPQQPSYRDGKLVTPTGVSGVKYERQIKASKSLSEREKLAALQTLRQTLAKVATGELPDFRMIIRGSQRATHSDMPEFSGRATELAAKGFCILPYHKNGTKPGDVWHIIPEDQWRTDLHYAVFPTELCDLPLRATCPADGIVLDPFVGTGTTIIAALQQGKRGIGIDTSATYLDGARQRIESLLETQRFVQGGLWG